jgi:hypothetical protein
MVMPFGKYQGVAVERLPPAYLRWLLRQDWPRPWMRAALEQERDRRREASRQRASPPPPAVAVPPMAARIVKAGFRAKAHQNHPDRGGSNETMREVNDAWAWLRDHFGGRA